MATTRAKFRCTTVEQSSSQPTEVQRYTPGKEPSTYLTWPRTFRFQATYDPDMPEDQRYAQATPIGNIEMRVDNPAVSFEPGRDYYLDFTLAE
jgi:hypothetical protein